MREAVYNLGIVSLVLAALASSPSKIDIHKGVNGKPPAEHGVELKPLPDRKKRRSRRVHTR
jgi:hypothetical protein